MAIKTTPARTPARVRKPPVAQATAAKVAPAKAPVKQVVAVAKAAAAAAPKSTDKAGKKPAKARPQLVRDSFTMPEVDFALIATLKARALGAKRHAKKSELLRAGLQALSALDAQSLVASLDRLQAIKVGRPKKGH